MARNKFPMGGMGMGGNMNQMIKQAQKMQQDMLKMQEELEETTVEASAGGGMVTVTATAKKEITAIKIDPECVDPEDVEMLEDLILAAIKDAGTKAKEIKDDKMGGFGNLGGLM